MSDDRPLRFKNATLDVIERLVEEAYDPVLPPNLQSPVFYDLLDRYSRAKHVYMMHELYGRDKEEGSS